MATVNEKMTAIADNIRSKTGGTEALSLDGMADGVNEVYDKGRENEMRNFWEKLIGEGASANSFSGSIWNDETFQPTQDVVFARSNGNWMFSLNKITSVKASLAIHGVKMDTSQLRGLGYAFFETQTIDLPELDLRGCINRPTSDLAMGVHGNTKLVTIDKIIFPTTWGKISSWNGFLQNNSSLQNIVVEGVIPCSLNLSVSPLTVESMKSIISHLNNYAGTSNAGIHTLTLKDTCKTAMANLGAIAEFGGKTYDAYLTDIGWNLA